MRLFDATFRFTVILLLALLHTTTLADDQPCSVTKDGKLFDLSPLAKKEITINHPRVDKSQFSIEVCAPNGKAGATLIRVSNEKVSLGLGNPTPYVTGDSVFLKYISGDNCGNSNGTYKRSSLLVFQCDPSLAPGNPVFIEDFDECNYVFLWKSSYACPKSISEGSFFGTLFTITIIGFGVYMVLGALYKKFFLYKDGLEVIPHMDFWEKCLGKIRSLFSRNRAQYGTVSADDAVYIDEA